MDWLNESKDWHGERAKGIGSSDIAVVMGLSPFKDVYTLFLEKTNQLPDDKKFKGNYATERGTRLEPLARTMYEAREGTAYPPINMVRSDYPWARANLDGLSTVKGKVLEIKCPGSKAHEEAMLGRVPGYYMPQCQYLLWVSGYEQLDYVSWDGESPSLVIVPVTIDHEFRRLMIEKAKEFWSCVERRECPESWKPVELVQGSDSLQDVLEIREKIKLEIESLTEKLDYLTAQVRELAPVNTQAGRYKIIYTEVKGSIDYSRIPALSGVELEHYRKQGTRRMKISYEDT